MAPQKTKTSDIPEDVPMFLRKTYHMIDSCDPTIACWSDDGETFVVKDPQKFETQIIPQFFKHSKFTSFVRQLNFYSFRKIKYVDTIRLDPKLEAETANFWRFRHENFQRGKPQLLTEIKRMTASQSRAATEKAKATNQSTPPVPGDSSNINSSSSSNAEMKEEIDVLKKQLEEMNRNMSQLTSMVQKVSIQDTDNSSSTTMNSVQLGNKRKKVDFALPDTAPSANTNLEPSLDALLPEYEYEALFPSDPMEMEAMSSALEMALPDPQPSSREASNMTDTDFVDQLFNAFGDPDSDINADTTEAEPVAVPSQPLPEQSARTSNPNRPDPELMDRLSDALAVLPKDMQEQIVNRLIASITSNSLFADTKTLTSESDELLPLQTPDQGGEALGMPLAAATLASLLSYYSNLVKDKQQQQISHSPKHVKSIPVISCHA